MCTFSRTGPSPSGSDTSMKLPDGRLPLVSRDQKFYLKFFPDTFCQISGFWASSLICQTEYVLLQMLRVVFFTVFLREEPGSRIACLNCRNRLVLDGFPGTGHVLEDFVQQEKMRFVQGKHSFDRALISYAVITRCTSTRSLGLGNSTCDRRETILYRE